MIVKCPFTRGTKQIILIFGFDYWELLNEGTLMFLNACIDSAFQKQKSSYKILSCYLSQFHASLMPFLLYTRINRIIMKDMNISKERFLVTG